MAPLRVVPQWEATRRAANAAGTRGRDATRLQCRDPPSGHTARGRITPTTPWSPSRHFWFPCQHATPSGLRFQVLRFRPGGGLTGCLSIIARDAVGFSLRHGSPVCSPCTHSKGSRPHRRRPNQSGCMTVVHGRAEERICLPGWQGEWRRFATKEATPSSSCL